MSLHHYPKISTNGLILCLDAANPQCFSDGLTSCTNLISGGEVTGASGQPNAGPHTPNTANFPAYNSVNGGVFDFAGGKGMNVEEDLGSHFAMSLSMWIYRTAALNQYVTDARNDGGGWFFSNYQTVNLNYTALLQYDFSPTHDATDPDFINQWRHMVVTSDVNGSLIYLDGYEVSVHPLYNTSYIANASLDEDLGKNFRIGTRYTTANPWTGYMGPIHIYNRKISSKEVKQIFNASRGRFGL